MIKKLKYIIIAFSVVVIAGCSQNNEAAVNKNNENAANGAEIKQEQVYASVGGKKITEEEIDYECFRAKLQNVLANKAGQNTCPPEKTIITQIIELKAIDYLAEEKGVSATTEEVQQRIEELKKEETSNSTFQEMVATFGEEKFWKYEEQRYNTIINSEKVKETLYEEEKEKNSYLDEPSLRLNAKKAFDDLIVEAVGMVDATIFYY
ncbi:MAG TPA: hypothetical protein GX497_18280 [Bacillus bacterium]|nr:hypothetical protein [Bacillus sp. (in: firmicutes)]